MVIYARGSHAAAAMEVTYVYQSCSFYKSMCFVTGLADDFSDFDNYNPNDLPHRASHAQVNGLNLRRSSANRCNVTYFAIKMILNSNIKKNFPYIYLFFVFTYSTTTK